MSEGPKLLFVKSRKASFIELDQQLLSERYALAEIYQPGKFSNPLRTVRAVLSADVVVGWWASWHTFIPFTVAWLTRTPSLLIVGGFDTAAEPEFGYGYQLGGVRKHLSRWIMRRAHTLMTNSEYSRAEVKRNCGIPAARVEVVYHGIPDTGGAHDADTTASASGGGDDGDPKRPMALTVGILDTTNLTRKGLKPFVEAATLLPDIEFVLAGKPSLEAAQALQAIATPNVTFAGFVSDEELARLYDTATVYVQASKHEGFGVSLAEAMLHQCIPVATTAGALPEVVGETGVILTDADPRTVAAGIETALERAQDPTAGPAARERITARFSVDQRRTGLYDLIDALLR